MARYRRFRRVFSRAKRNAERVLRSGTSDVTNATQQTAYTYTAPTACVVKSIKLDMGMTTGAAYFSMPYALVVVREGYDANTINYPAITDDLYNPTMDVLISGVLTDGAVEDHKFNMIGRKLKRGDRICLIVRGSGVGGGDQGRVVFEMNFSVLT